MTDLILVRHGETDWNRELRFQGHIDVPLNETGQEQARRLGLRLAGERIDQFYCSDLLRAQQTAAPAARALAARLTAGAVPYAALREQHFGICEGMRSADIQRDHPQEWAQWSRFHPDFALPGGESAQQFHTRAMAALRELAARHPGATLAVVTHGGVLDMVWRTARSLGLHGPRQSDIPNAAVNRVRLDGDAIEVLEWADTRHLADMPPQPVYTQVRLADVPPPEALRNG